MQILTKNILKVKGINNLDSTEKYNADIFFNLEFKV